MLDCDLRAVRTACILVQALPSVGNKFSLLYSAHGEKEAEILQQYCCTELLLAPRNRWDVN